LLAAVFLSSVFGSSTQPKSSASKKSTPKIASKASPKTSAKAAPRASSKAAPKAAPQAHANAPARGKAPVRRRAVVVTRHTTPSQPDADRIREIQSALSEHGYTVEPTGVWGADSVAALKKFQEDQNINNVSGRGKLDSLTLIALGLGPRRDPLPGPAASAQAPMEGTKP
jgi:hypothetical protein